MTTTRAKHVKVGAQSFDAMPPIPIAIAVCVLCFMVYATWACFLPVNMAPDEEARYLLVNYIFQTGQLPTGFEEEVRMLNWGTSYAFSVYGSTLLAQLLLWPARLIMGSLSVDQVYVVSRFANVLMATGTVAVCFPLGKRLFRRPATTVLFAVLVGLLPQFVFLSAYFNCDVMGTLTVGLVMLCLLRGVENSWRWGDCVLLGVALGFNALSYYFAYAAIVVSIIVYFATAARVPVGAGRSRLSMLVVRPLVVFACAFLVAGWFFVRFYIIYDGDIFGRSASTVAGEMYASEDWLKPSQHKTPANQGMSVPDMLFSAEQFDGIPWIESTLRSFIGTFGYMSLILSPNEYTCYFVFLGVGLAVGLVANILTKGRRFTLFWMLLLVLIPVGLTIYYSWSGDYQPQGRYIMSCLVPLMGIVAYGWETVACLPDAVFSRWGNMGTVARDRIVFVIECVLIFLWVFLFAHVVYVDILPNCVGPFGEVWTAWAP